MVICAEPQHLLGLNMVGAVFQLWAGFLNDLDHFNMKLKEAYVD